MRLPEICDSLRLKTRAQRFVKAAVKVSEWVWQKVNTERGANLFFRALEASAVGVTAAYLLGGGDKKIQAAVGGLLLLGLFEWGRTPVLHMINTRNRPEEL